MLNKLDAVLITHTHRDHWDLQAQQLLDKNITIFCQPVDLEKIKSQGFQQVIAVESPVSFKSITISRTGGASFFYSIIVPPEVGSLYRSKNGIVSFKIKIVN